jgi:hypothetical protein
VPTKSIDMCDDIDKGSPVYNEEQLSKMLANISQDKPITLAEAIAYEYIDLEDPKLCFANDTIRCIKSLFRPTPLEDETTLNLIRIKRSGKHLTDFNLAETNPLEKFHVSEPFIYQLQQSFEPTLDFNEKQFRSLTETILNNQHEYSTLQFDIGRTLIPAGDVKESSTNDFSQSDSGYSMTTTTHDSLASKVKNEFETINEPVPDQCDESDKVSVIGFFVVDFFSFVCIVDLLSHIIRMRQATHYEREQTPIMYTFADPRSNPTNIGVSSRRVSRQRSVNRR